MLSPIDTAYPILKESPTGRELQELFTPNLLELGFAREHEAARSTTRAATTSQIVPEAWLFCPPRGRFLLRLSYTLRRQSVGTMFRMAYRLTMSLQRGFATWLLFAPIWG